MVDASNPTQLSASCTQLLGLLSAEPLADAQVLILFNKTYGSVGLRGAQRPGEGWPLREGCSGGRVGLRGHFNQAPLSLQ